MSVKGRATARFGEPAHLREYPSIEPDIEDNELYETPGVHENAYSSRFTDRHPECRSRNCRGSADFAFVTHDDKCALASGGPYCRNQTKQLHPTGGQAKSPVVYSAGTG